MKYFLILAAIFALSFPALAQDKVKESAYDRVMRTQTIRCGYGVWDPWIIKDINTGKLSGIFYDVTEALGKSLNLKIEWTEEIGWGDFPEALRTGRIDAFCTGTYPSGARAREMIFTQPVFYMTVDAYARADDHRFDNNLEAINSENVTLTMIDGDINGTIGPVDFPKAKILSLPQLSSQPQQFLEVTGKKADIVFCDTPTGKAFISDNPGQIKMVEGGAGLRVSGNTLALKSGETDLKAMMDTATGELLQSGVVEKILKKYEKHPGSFMRVTKPYEAKE